MIHNCLFQIFLGKDGLDFVRAEEREMVRYLKNKRLNNFKSPKKWRCQ